ncbi:MAG: hypothetical protein ACM3KH_00320 [Thiobacillus sp.]
MDREIQPTPENSLPKTRISDLLLRYQDIFNDPVYMVVESMDINGHEVAWMQYVSPPERPEEDQEDICDEDRERGSREVCFGHKLLCACDFTEGVGWDTDEKNAMIVFHDEPDHCPCKLVALHRRHAQLLNEYIDRGLLNSYGENMDEDIEEIIFDLMQKSMDHEFIELDNGAHFWGGYFYLQTIESITGIPLDVIMSTADRMTKENKIKLSGSVVRSFSAEDVIRDYLTVEKDDWFMTAALNDRDQSWDIALFDQNGDLVDIKMHNPMEFIPPFAVGPGDIERINDRLEEIMDEVRGGDGFDIKYNYDSF